MKVVNIMNFVRQCEPRRVDSDYMMFEATKGQLNSVNKYNVDNTFLLQYDVLCDQKYIDLFKQNAKENTELGLWYEIVEPLTSACGMEYRSKFGWKWDWHIVPGFSMGYKVKERESLIDEAMRKFKEIFGYYPKTVGSWVIDTHTINYLTEHYQIDAFCICRDQIGTDAYTCVGGYFNQAYYPSKKNMFTPAQTLENQLDVPVIRLLGPSPIHNYDNTRYASRDTKTLPFICTIEPAVYCGYIPHIVDWYYKAYFENEDLGFSYIQIGQENSMETDHEIVLPVDLQIKKAMQLKDVKIQKMCDTGKWFKQTYSTTPATACSALDNWDRYDAQSVYYDCRNYTANIFRNEKQIFIRAWYIFDENIKDNYLTEECKTFDAIYENMPIVDTIRYDRNKSVDIGLVIDNNGSAFSLEKVGEGELLVKWGDKSVLFTEKGIAFYNVDTLVYHKQITDADISVEEDCLQFVYKGHKYAVKTGNCTMTEKGDCVYFEGKDIQLKL